MPNLLRRGAERLAELRREHATDRVVYRRGERSIEVRASPGRTEFDVESSAGLEKIESLDWLVNAGDLQEFGDPQRGDEIETINEVDGKRRTFGVFHPDRSSPVWRWADGYRQTLRIHTKQRTRSN